jgi:hypothetical protein
MSKHRLYEDSPFEAHTRFNRTWATRPQRGVPRRRRPLWKRVCGPVVASLTLAVLLLVGDYQ